ncbi:enhancer of split malpha protein-like [Rhagoletis pomonella]|uniref:enhancer of split malpha protein-like n=1 Tax=Rhagoletis pomonella TaxID=28610 RepID=UPI0017820513|nr:enhancer of split malpha protein-like [Rhagoletis pomonella]
MCQQQQLAAAANNANNIIHQQAQQQQSSKLKPSYSIKRVLQTLFRNKQHQHQQQQQKLKQQRRQQQRLQQQCQRLCNSLESLESLENLRNAQMEEQHLYEEIQDNSANEKLAVLVQEAASSQREEDETEEHDIYVPVRFARTTAGTFFWTTNLQPVLSSFAPVAADEDLLQPSYRYSNAQYPHMQYPAYQPDRWAQA